MADLTKRQIEQLALIMQFLYELGFDLSTVKHAADCWWKVKAGVPDGSVADRAKRNAGVPAPDVVERFVAQQEPLGEPFTKVLMDNLPDLYSKDGVPVTPKGLTE